MREIATAALAMMSLMSAGFAAELKWATLTDGRLAYVDVGSGPPVVMIHGGLQDYRFWKDILPLLPDHRLIAYSRRSHYPNEISSEAIPDNAADLHADDLAAFLKSIGLPKANVIAHSSGAHAALFFAAKYPEMVQALAVHEPPAVGLLAGDAEGAAELKELGARLAPSRAAFLNGDLQAGVRLFTDAINNPGAYERRPASDRDMIIDNAPSHAADSTSKRPRTSFTCQMARSITASVLVTTSETSLRFFHLVANALERCLSRVERHQFANAPHTVQSDQPKEFSSVIRVFLAKN